jgi:uncharacterized protein (UPF0261 family)
MTRDPPATLDEPDTDAEVIAKLRAEVNQLRTFAYWVYVTSNDPRFVKKALAVLKRKP